MLRDSAHIQEFEAEWKNRKGRRAGKPEVVPTYTMEDAEGVLEHFAGCDYNKIVDIFPQHSHTKYPIPFLSRVRGC